ncbi:hypothetical protein ACFCP7_21375 [Paenibacillus elgii]
MNRKFIFFSDSQFIEEFNDFADRLVYFQQDYEKFSRLVIWPSDKAIFVICELLKITKEKYEVFYILRSSRCNNEEARYKMEAVDLKTITEFLEKFGTYLEYDSRHRIVIRSSDERLTYFVFDEENIILAYGNVEEFKLLLNRLGFDEYNKPLIYPEPHMHLYQEELDKYEDKVLSYFPWVKSKLTEVDR